MTISITVSTDMYALRSLVILVGDNERVSLCKVYKEHCGQTHEDAIEIGKTPTNSESGLVPNRDMHMAVVRASKCGRLSVPGTRAFSEFDALQGVFAVPIKSATIPDLGNAVFAGRTLARHNIFVRYLKNLPCCLYVLSMVAN